jgi:hypothetical protein
LSIMDGFEGASAWKLSAILSITRLFSEIGIILSK